MKNGDKVICKATGRAGTLHWKGGSGFVWFDDATSFFGAFVVYYDRAILSADFRRALS